MINRSFKASDDLWSKIQDRAREEEITASDLIRRLMKLYLDGRLVEKAWKR